jgi:O-acetyl-ADP-ribose deacetylase (regulator of RNase III)
MVKYMNGNLLESGCDYICHQVNCQGKMGSGIAKQIRDKWSIVYNNYMAKCNTTINGVTMPGSFLLGSIQIVGLWEDFYKTEFHQSVINMFAQNYYGYDGKKYTSYDAFAMCLEQIRDTVPQDKRIGFPYNIGCDRGGANWNIISTMIEEILKDHDVEIWRLKNE